MRQGRLPSSTLKASLLTRRLLMEMNWHLSATKKVTSVLSCRYSTALKTTIFFRATATVGLNKRSNGRLAGEGHFL